MIKHAFVIVLFVCAIVSGTFADGTVSVPGSGDGPRRRDRSNETYGDFAPDVYDPFAGGVTALSGARDDDYPVILPWEEHIGELERPQSIMRQDALYRAPSGSTLEVNRIAEQKKQKDLKKQKEEERRKAEEKKWWKAEEEKRRKAEEEKQRKMDSVAHIVNDVVSDVTETNPSFGDAYHHKDRYVVGGYGLTAEPADIPAIVELQPEYMRPVVNKYIENDEQKLLFWQGYERLYNEKDGNVTLEDIWQVLFELQHQVFLSESRQIQSGANQVNLQLAIAHNMSPEYYNLVKLTRYDVGNMIKWSVKNNPKWIDNAQEMIDVLSIYASPEPISVFPIPYTEDRLNVLKKGMETPLNKYFNTTQCTLLDAERFVKLYALIELGDDNVNVYKSISGDTGQDMIYGKSKKYIRYYTWEFDDVTESWDITRGNSIVRTLGDLLKINLGNSNDCHGFNKLNSTICNKLLPMAKTAWPDNPEMFCYFPTVAKTIFGVEPVYENGTCQAQLATVTEDLHVALDSKHDNDYGLESTAFCGIQVNASTGLTDQINDYIINRSGGLCWATYCSRSPVQYNGGACGQSRFNYDDIMTCNYSCLTADGGIDENNTINFVFDDLSQGGDFISRAGNSGASCIAYGGAYDGKNCRFLGRAECNALGEKYDIEVRWDAESGLCRMADSVTANYINTGIRLGVTTVVIAATGGMAGAGAGQILGAVALNVAAEGIMEEAQRELEKLPQQTAQRFVDAIEQCDCTKDKGKQCAQKAVEEYLGQALSHEYSISDPEMKKRMKDAINSAKTCLGDVEFAAAVRKSTPIGWEEGMVMAMGFFGVFLDGDFDSSDAAHLGAVDDITDMAMQYGDDLVEVGNDAARVGRSTDNLTGVASRSGHDFNVVGRLDGTMDDTIVVAYSNGNREFVVTVSPRSTGKIYRFDDGTEFKFIGQNGDFLQFDCPDGIIIIDVSDAKKIDTSDVVFDIWDEVDDADDGGVEIIDVKKTNDATAAVGRVDDVVDVVEGLGVKNPSYSGKWDVTSVYYNGHELPIVAKGVKSGRPIVVVKVNDMHIPFYISTGKAQKMGVPTGKWEFFGGITDSGWFRKGTEEEIVRHYDTVHLRGIAEALDEQVGDLRDVLDVERSAARAARGAEGHVATATENRSISISDINQTTKDYVVHDYRVPPTSWVKDLDSRADLYFSGGYDINALKQSASSSFDKYLNDFLETGQSVVGLPESRLDQRGWTSLDGYLRKEYSVRLKKEVTSEGVPVMKFQKNELRF